MPCRPRRKIAMPSTAASACVTSVASAAPITPGRRDRSPAEDEQRIEHEIQDHRAEHDEERHARLADAAHQRLEHGVDEDEDDADERHAHEAERAGVDVGRDAEQRRAGRATAT